MGSLEGLGHVESGCCGKGSARAEDSRSDGFPGYGSELSDECKGFVEEGE